MPVLAELPRISHPVKPASYYTECSPKPLAPQTPHAVWVALIVVLGLALRSYHYFSDPPVWHDEAAQIYNVLNKDYGEMLGPLYYAEACPPLFLALEKSVVAILGDSTLALRLLPFLASCLVNVGLVLLARRLLAPSGLMWLALLLSCSDRLLWHATEAKPYAVDTLVATCVLAIGLRFCADCSPNSDRFRRMLGLSIALTPFIVFLSFPGCFLLGGLALALVPAVFRSRNKQTWVFFGCFCVSLCGSFLALYFTAIQAQRNDSIASCWTLFFPSWDQPWLLPDVALVRFTELCRYALEPAGNALAVLVVVGGVALCRAGHQRLVGILLLPIGLNTIAWLLSSYPLGPTRVNVYAAPALLVLIAAGIGPALAWLREWHRLAAIVLIGVLLVPVGQAIGVFIKPWTRLDSKTPTAFILEHRQPNEPVVGTLWEHAYYCRQLGPLYRAIRSPVDPPSPAPAAALGPDGIPSEEIVDSLWLLATQDPLQQAGQIAGVHPGGPWQIAERYVFRNVVVLRLQRVPH
jgi:hypothetical protein